MPRLKPLLRPQVTHPSKTETTEDGLTLFTFPDGFRCYSHSSELETALIYNEIFVQQTYLGNRVSLQGCQTLFDVGANIGMFTMFAKLQQPDLIVHAFEPIKATYDVLVKNMALHHLTDVYLHNYALGQHYQSQRSMTFYPHAAGNATAYPEAKAALIASLEDATIDYLFQSAETQLVTMRTLAEVLHETGVSSVDLLKIDTEGDELAILQGCTDSALLTIRQIAAEIHSADLLAAVRHLLGEQGFAVVATAGTVHNHNLYAIRQATED